MGSEAPLELEVWVLYEQHKIQNVVVWLCYLYDSLENSCEVMP